MVKNEIRIEVVVPVDPNHASAHRLWEIHLAIGPIALGPVDAGFSAMSLNAATGILRFITLRLLATGVSIGVSAIA